MSASQPIARRKIVSWSRMPLQCGIRTAAQIGGSRVAATRLSAVSTPYILSSRQNHMNARRQADTVLLVTPRLFVCDSSGRLMAPRGRSVRQYTLAKCENSAGQSYNENYIVKRQQYFGTVDGLRCPDEISIL